MDRDYYLQRHEEELDAASKASCAASRRAHEQLARAYEEVIGRFGKPVAVVSDLPNLASSSDQPRRSRAG